MHPFHVLLTLFAIFSLLAFVFMLRWERSFFFKLGKGKAWLAVRLASIPIAIVTAALIIIPARSISGMEGLGVFYLLLFTIAPVFWFGAHGLTGKLVQPSLTFRESAQIAGSPLALAMVLSTVAHMLQPIAWSVLRATGLV